MTTSLSTCRSALACVLLSGALLGSVADSRADMIYTFVNYPSLQNGYTIYGKIVTNGNMGFLSSKDIATQPDSAYSATSLSISNSGYSTPLPAYFSQFNGLYATTLNGVEVLEAAGTGGGGWASPTTTTSITPLHTIRAVAPIPRSI
jgi:hypothetical protein